ncbi:hypothetical protein COO91_01443 [Nostoc flagelliforme CCNUN1]|uniref:Uncharacterized protein n=1 Tax=Nostoc flagelliforme CCNUN1 TaxID=2038116 RepID=A0A2K8SL38_9NOSO|nr:hypothetical protein COO91_01443 [Nostoc flagelliforme CCNUN1]
MIEEKFSYREYIRRMQPVGIQNCLLLISKPKSFLKVLPSGHFS